jgi:hypothetical protein
MTAKHCGIQLPSGEIVQKPTKHNLNEVVLIFASRICSKPNAMKKIAFLLMLFPFLLALNACEQKSTTDSNPDEGKDTENSDPQGQSQESATSFEKGGLKVYSLDDSPKFPESNLEMTEPALGADLAAGATEFKFDVQNFELGAQTSDAADKGLANSGMGQHIHLILNNSPYTAHYMPGSSMDLEDGHYVLLAFLSRSYHESVKAPGAFVVRQFIAGQPGDYQEAKLANPHMFYSRPKGSYYGADTKKLLLDFFLVNCQLSPDGYKVRATVNGNDFMFTKWAPYVIEGLPMGEVKIKLELIDANGELVKSPFNPVERSVTLATEKPVE